MRKKGRRATSGAVRIFSGALGGRVIRFVDRPELRPTLGRVREAVFNILEPFGETHGFIDLCAGSGAMGFEACSVGFRPVLMLDTDPAIVRRLKENAGLLNADVTVIQAPAASPAFFLSRPGLYILYADPPYRDLDFHPKMLRVLTRTDAIAAGSLYIAEQESGDFPGLDQTGFSLFKQKKYGRTHLLFLAKQGDNRGKQIKA